MYVFPRHAHTYSTHSTCDNDSDTSTALTTELLHQLFDTKWFPRIIRKPQRPHFLYPTQIKIKVALTYQLVIVKQQQKTKQRHRYSRYMEGT